MNTLSLFQEWSSVQNVRSEMRNKFEQIGDRLSTVDQIMQKLTQLERMMLQMTQQGNGGHTPSTMPMGSLMVLNDSQMAHLESPAMPVTRSVSWSEHQDAWQR